MGSNAGVSLGMGSDTGVGSGVGSGTGVSLDVGLGMAVGMGMSSGVSSGTGITFGADNSVGFSGGNGVDSSGGNSVGSGAKVSAGGDPREGLVYLGTQTAETVIGLAFSGVYTAVPTFPIAGRGHPTPASLVSQAVKSTHLLSCAKVVSESAAIRPFENTQDTTMYNEFLEVTSDNEE